MKKFLKASVNEEKNISLEDHFADLDLIKIADNEYHALWKNRSLRIKVQSWSRDDELITLEINDEIYEVRLQDELDDLISKMGFNSSTKPAHDKIYAPMPGRVLRVDINPGEQVIEGDSLIILEAMKMENIIKASANGTIKNVLVTAGSTVDKGDLIVEYE